MYSSEMMIKIIWWQRERYLTRGTCGTFLFYFILLFIHILFLQSWTRKNCTAFGLEEKFILPDFFSFYPLYTWETLKCLHRLITSHIISTSFDVFWDVKQTSLSEQGATAFRLAQDLNFKVQFPRLAKTSIANFFLSTFHCRKRQVYHKHWF